MFGKKPQPKPDLEYFTIYDTKVGAYRTPMPAQNSDHMMRQIVDMMIDPSQTKNELLVNAEDFQLHRVGVWNFDSGALTGYPPEHVANFQELRYTATQKLKELSPFMPRQQASADLGIVPT